MSYYRDVQGEYDDEEDKDSRTRIIYSVSEVGQMVDFLKANPFVSMEDYRWGLSVPMIKLMMYDNTHVHYLSEKEKAMGEYKKIDGTNLKNDLGIPIFE